MKRIRLVLAGILCFLHAFFPLCCVIGWLSGYPFALCSFPAFLLTLSAVSLLVTVLLFRQPAPAGKTAAVLAALLLFLSFLNGFFLLWRPGVCKIIGITLSCLTVLPLIGLFLLNLIFDDFGYNAVVRSVPSPEGGRVAEIIDSNQGALGGDTLVTVQFPGKTVDIGVGRFLKKPVNVYMGEWGEFRSIRVHWQDEETLVIDGTEYSVPR